MENLQHYFDQLFFTVLPYVSLILFFVFTIYRYRKETYTYSSLSSQFLENQKHFWSVVPFHYGIIVVIVGHIAAFLLPKQILLWNGSPFRLYILETCALIFGLLTLIGLLSLIVRRITFSKIRTVTTLSDWILFALLLIQVGVGVAVAVFHPWGSSWFATSMTPYLWSLVKLNPDITYVVSMPWLVKIHIINASLLIGFFPFTRLVHVLVIPNPYLWRKPQVVRWNWTPSLRNRTEGEKHGR